MSVAFWDSFFWSDSAKKAGAAFSQGDPLLAAQQIKNCVRDADWRYLVNKALYYGPEPQVRSRLFEQLAHLCSAPGFVESIINSNYDSLFEHYLHERGVAFSVLWSPDCRCPPNTVPVYHPHGYLKYQGGPATPIILAEGDYLAHSNQPYLWPNVVQLACLAQSPCLFVGCSMRDPNIRRLLRTASGVGRSTHFAFLPSCDATDIHETMYDALFDRDLATLGVRAIRFPRNLGSPDVYSHLCDLIALLPSLRNDPQEAWRRPNLNVPGT